jgi:hypothetical protein
MTLFGRSSYPYVELHDIAAQCSEHGVDASPPLEAPEFDFIVIGGNSVL